MATHSSMLAWRIPWTEEPGGLPSMGSQSWSQLKRLSSSSNNHLRKVLKTIRCGGLHMIDCFVFDLNVLIHDV